MAGKMTAHFVALGDARMPHQTEPSANNALGNILQGMLGKATVRSENTQVIQGHAEPLSPARPPYCVCGGLTARPVRTHNDEKATPRTRTAAKVSILSKPKADIISIIFAPDGLRFRLR